MSNTNPNYKYFLFSNQQVIDKNKIYNKIHKVIVLGRVSYNGEVKEFSTISNTKDLPRYSDSRVIAQGDITTMEYTMPTTKTRRSNEE